VTIKNSVVMGADYTEEKGSIPEGTVPLGIGAGSTISGAILDKNSRVGSGVSITNAGNVESLGENESLQVRDGISIVIKNGTIEDGFQF
jgi:glucose-1-phosphate adenylyltransferase